MKKHIFPLVFFALAITLPAQDLLEIKHSCNFDGEEQQTEFYAFEASGEANQIVGKIVKSVNLAQNFVVKSADCKNALATVRGRDRYILYSTTFLEQFKKESRTKWAAYCVLAHEIGHHLNNHDIESTDPKARKRMELEADKFAGGVLFVLGATLTEAQAGIEMLQTQGETTTHPPARARAEAIANGWKNSQENFNKITDQRETEQPETQPSEKKFMPPSPEKNLPANQKSNPEKSEPRTFQDTGNGETVNFTAVSDGLMAQNIVGNWECSFLYEGSYISSFASFYGNGTGFGQSFLNGILFSTSTVTWTISQGIITQIDTNTGIYEKYNLVFNGHNYFSVTFLATNGVVGVPIGTMFNYTRKP